MNTNLVTCMLVVVLMLGIPCGALADYAAAVLGDGPIAYWRFDDGNPGDILNGAVAKDSVGTGNGDHPGTYTVTGANDGVELVAGVPGIGGTAGHFVKGTDGEYVLYDTLGSFGSQIDDNGASFEFWFKNLQEDMTNNRLFGVWNERPGVRTTQFSFTVYRPSDTDKQELFLRDDDDMPEVAYFDNSLKDMNDGQWHHAAWVIEPGVPAEGMKAYVDGVEMTLDFPTSNIQTNFSDLDKGLIVGGEHAASFKPQNFVINAMIDEFAVYSKPLSQAQIQAHLDEVVGQQWPGDANGDGKVTDADAAILATNWQQCSVGWSQGDFNADGCVTDADAAILATNWQHGVTEAAAVPEPATWILLAGVCASLLVLRCKRSE